jgi:hypothetical protein
MFGFIFCDYIFQIKFGFIVDDDSIWFGLVLSGSVRLVVTNISEKPAAPVCKYL